MALGPKELSIVEGCTYYRRRECMMFDTCGMKGTVSNRGRRGCRAQWCGQPFLGSVVYL